jgi:signal peptidase II
MKTSKEILWAIVGLDFRLIRFPVFNLADVFINIGIVCLLIATFRGGLLLGKRVE